MKKILAFGFIALLLINCGGSDNNPEEQKEVDSVVAVNDAYEVDEDASIVINNFLSNDTFTSNSIEVEVSSVSEEEGTIVFKNNEITYTPTTGFVGVDSFEYTICSTITEDSCDTATVTITVNETSNPGGNTEGFNIPSELATYYNDVDFSLTGASLKDELATKITSTHATFLSYTPGVWEAVKKSDLDPTDDSKVLLIYGYDDNDGNYVTDRSRRKNENGGDAGSEWNREHVYPKSLGNPNLGTQGAGSDAHHLRPCDITFNSQRSNKKFATGSGNAGSVSNGWYPGDEWKGDVARMMMYMYLRYGNQCLPKNVANGSVASSDSNMINLLLEWNEEDPVSEFEKNRNNVIADEQGNRNPIIDNPYLATVIWGGNSAENTWE